MRILQIAALLTILTPALTANTAIDGTWKATFSDPQADQPMCCAYVVLELKTDGQKVTGTAYLGDWPGKSPVPDGTIKDGHFSFTAFGKLDSDSGYPQAKFEGTVHDDRMKLTMAWGPAGSQTVWHKWDMVGQRLPK